MDKKEMDRLLAEEVMGWVVQAHDIKPPFDFWWHNENDWPTVKISLWHPTKSWDQMMMCVEKMRGYGYSYKIWDTDKYYHCKFIEKYINGEKLLPEVTLFSGWQGDNKNPLLAIGEAILRAEGKWEEK